MLCDRLPMEPPVGGGLALFPAMRKASTTATPMGSATGNPRIAASPMVGIGLAGARRWINGLTGSLPML